MRNHLSFLGQFLTNPTRVASVIQTSPFGVQRISNQVRMRTGKTVIVEYGPGCRPDLAKHLLQRADLSLDSKIILIEQDPKFASALEEERDRLGDPRLKVSCNSAERVRDVLREEGEEAADILLSSIPITIFPADVRNRILTNSHAALREDGEFIVFLFLKKIREYLEEYFTSVTEHPRVWLNFPPLRIFTAKKGSHPIPPAMYAEAAKASGG
jgi:phospholipid N-methyltransferase